MKVTDSRATVKVDSEKWYRGRLTLTGRPLGGSHYPVTEVHLDFVDVPGKSATPMGVVLNDDRRSLIFRLDDDHRAEWLTLLHSRKSVKFFIHRIGGKHYSLGLGQ